MSPATGVPERFQVGDLLVDSTTRQVMREGREIALSGLSFDLLLALARHAPRLVSVDELMEEVWPGRVVNAETVAKRVELVREALGDDSHEPRYIALVRGCRGSGHCAAGSWRAPSAGRSYGGSAICSRDAGRADSCATSNRGVERRRACRRRGGAVDRSAPRLATRATSGRTNSGRWPKSFGGGAAIPQPE
jgi:hypothetical protein